MSDNNLRLQVILNAVDKLTRPFRAAQASSKELAGAIQNTRNSLKELNKQAGRIDEFRKTRSQLAITANNLNAAREEAAKLATQFAATNRPTAAQAKLFSQAKTRVQELQQTYNGLLGAVQRQRQALKKSGIDTRQLSSAQRELKKNAEETRQALEGQQKALKRLGEQQARMNAVRDQYSRRLEVRDRIAGAGATTTAAGLAMGAPVMAAVKSYTSMEDAMKGVAKQVNGLRDDNGNRTARFYEMQDAIKAASEQLPMENGAVDFAALVEGGARMNVANPDDSWEDQKRDLLAFASTDENVLVLNRTYANRSNAERAAKMQWERLQRGVASFSLQLAEGRADLYTEMPVKVSGFKQPIDDAEWTITTLTHTVSPDNGFTTSLELEVRIDDFEME